MTGLSESGDACMGRWAGGRGGGRWVGGVGGLAVEELLKFY